MKKRNVPVSPYSKHWDKIPKVMKEDTVDIDGFKEGFREHKAIWEIRNAMRKITMSLQASKQAVHNLEYQLNFISAQCSDVGIMIISDINDLLERINTALPQAIAEAYTPYEELKANPEETEAFYKTLIEQKESEIKGLMRLLEMTQKVA